MPSRIITVRTLSIAFVSVLMCAIFASEMPELLSLTDNVANDYTLRRADSSVSPVLDNARKVQKPVLEFNFSTQDFIFWRVGSPEKKELALCLFILYSALRR
jgi:hypothetical protein